MHALLHSPPRKAFLPTHFANLHDLLVDLAYRHTHNLFDARYNFNDLHHDALEEVRQGCVVTLLVQWWQRS